MLRDYATALDALSIRFDLAAGACRCKQKVFVLLDTARLVERKFFENLLAANEFIDHDSLSRRGGDRGFRV